MSSPSCVCAFVRVRACAIARARVQVNLAEVCEHVAELTRPVRVRRDKENLRAPRERGTPLGLIEAGGEEEDMTDQGEEYR